MTPEEKQSLSVRAGKVFSPAAPIREKDVFSGRRGQITAVIDAINQAGQHALVYGERGVGKTSLANVLSEFLASAGQTGIITTHTNCDTTDTFASVWQKVFGDVSFSSQQLGFGFNKKDMTEDRQVSEMLPDEPTPNDIVSLASELSRQRVFIPVIDEFDRLSDRKAERLMTDTIKTLSDRVPNTTIVLVGVADTVEELIEEHGSVERALIQIRMPRMSRPELIEIIDTGLGQLKMTAREDAKQYIAKLSQGLPHYTHLLALHAVRAAIEEDSMELRVPDVNGAIERAISGAQQTLQRAYHKATMSGRRDALYRQVLLAAAMAAPDDLGYFAAADLRAPMERIMGRPYEIPAYSRHLYDFCEGARGPVLERTGVSRRFRFRFCNPLLQPFVIMQGLAANLIQRDDITNAD